MSSLSPKDRISLCLFTYEDGRRCRTPRISSHPHFCFYHAQKESQTQAAQSLAKDLAAFFSGDYLSANDLSTALARLIPAVLRGDIKPRLARTIAYMCQTLLQSIHAAQHEYIDAFGPEGWRKAIRSSVNTNYDHRFPPASTPVEAGPARPESAFASPVQPDRPTQSPEPSPKSNPLESNSSRPRHPKPAQHAIHSSPKKTGCSNSPNHTQIPQRNGLTPAHKQHT